MEARLEAVLEILALLADHHEDASLRQSLNELYNAVAIYAVDALYGPAVQECLRALPNPDMRVVLAHMLLALGPVPAELLKH